MLVTALGGGSQVCVLRAVGNLIKSLLASSHDLNKLPILFLLPLSEDTGTYLIHRSRIP